MMISFKEAYGRALKWLPSVILGVVVGLLALSFEQPQALASSGLLPAPVLASQSSQGGRSFAKSGIQVARPQALGDDSSQTYSSDTPAGNTDQASGASAAVGGSIGYSLETGATSFSYPLGAVHTPSIDFALQLRCNTGDRSNYFGYGTGCNLNIPLIIRSSALNLETLPPPGMPPSETEKGTPSYTFIDGDGSAYTLKVPSDAVASGLSKPSSANNSTISIYEQAQGAKSPDFTLTQCLSKNDQQDCALPAGTYTPYSSNSSDHPSTWVFKITWNNGLEGYFVRAASDNAVPESYKTGRGFLTIRGGNDVQYYNLIILKRQGDQQSVNQINFTYQKLAIFDSSPLNDESFGKYVQHFKSYYYLPALTSISSGSGYSHIRASFGAYSSSSTEQQAQMESSPVMGSKANEASTTWSFQDASNQFPAWFALPSGRVVKLTTQFLAPMSATGDSRETVLEEMKSGTSPHWRFYSGDTDRFYPDLVLTTIEDKPASDSATTYTTRLTYTNRDEEVMWQDGSFTETMGMMPMYHDYLGGKGHYYPDNAAVLKQGETTSPDAEFEYISAYPMEPSNAGDMDETLSLKAGHYDAVPDYMRGQAQLTSITFPSGKEVSLSRWSATRWAVENEDAGTEGFASVLASNGDATIDLTGIPNRVYGSGFVKGSQHEPTGSDSSDSTYDGWGMEKANWPVSKGSDNAYEVTLDYKNNHGIQRFIPEDDMMAINTIPYIKQQTTSYIDSQGNTHTIEGSRWVPNVSNKHFYTGYPLVSDDDTPLANSDPLIDLKVVHGTSLLGEQTSYSYSYDESNPYTADTAHLWYGGIHFVTKSTSAQANGDQVLSESVYGLYNNAKNLSMASQVQSYDQATKQVQKLTNAMHGATLESVQAMSYTSHGDIRSIEYNDGSHRVYFYNYDTASDGSYPTYNIDGTGLTTLTRQIASVYLPNVSGSVSILPASDSTDETLPGMSLDTAEMVKAQLGHRDSANAANPKSHPVYAYFTLNDYTNSQDEGGTHTISGLLLATTRGYLECRRNSSDSSYVSSCYPDLFSLDTPRASNPSDGTVMTAGESALLNDILAVGSAGDFSSYTGNGETFTPPSLSNDRQSGLLSATRYGYDVDAHLVSQRTFVYSTLLNGRLWAKLALANKSYAYYTGSEMSSDLSNAGISMTAPNIANYLPMDYDYRWYIVGTTVSCGSDGSSNLASGAGFCQDNAKISNLPALQQWTAKANGNGSVSLVVEAKNTDWIEAVYTGYDQASQSFLSSRIVSYDGEGRATTINFPNADRQQINAYHIGNNANYNTTTNFYCPSLVDNPSSACQWVSQQFASTDDLGRPVTETSFSYSADGKTRVNQSQTNYSYDDSTGGLLAQKTMYRRGVEVATIRPLYDGSDQPIGEWRSLVKNSAVSDGHFVSQSVSLSLSDDAANQSYGLSLSPCSEGSTNSSFCARTLQVNQNEIDSVANNSTVTIAGKNRFFWSKRYFLSPANKGWSALSSTDLSSLSLQSGADPEQRQAIINNLIDGAQSRAKSLMSERTVSYDIYDRPTLEENAALKDGVLKHQYERLSYNEKGQLVKRSNALSANLASAGGFSQWTGVGTGDQDIQSVSYRYDPLDQVVQAVQYADNPNSPLDIASNLNTVSSFHEKDYAYNSAGELRQELFCSSQSGGYSTQGCLPTASNTVTKFANPVYDGLGRLVSSEGDNNNELHDHSYNALGELTASAVTTTSGAASAAKVCMIYDTRLGKISALYNNPVGSDGKPQSCLYDGDNLPAAGSAEAESIDLIQYEYDESSFDKQAVVYPDNKSLSVGYGAAGQVSSVRDISGMSSSLTYDLAGGGLLDQATMDTGATVGISPTVSYAYDSLDRPDQVTVSQQSQGASSATTMLTTTASYDDELSGTQTTLSDVVGGASSPLLSIVSRHDDWGHLEQRDRSDETSSGSENSFDALSRLSTSLSGNHYSYDESGNNTELSHNDLDQISGSGYVYNTQGDMTQSPEGCYQFNGRDQLIRFQQAGANGRCTGHIFHYSYYPTGLRASKSVTPPNTPNATTNALTYYYLDGKLLNTVLSVNGQLQAVSHWFGRTARFVTDSQGQLMSDAHNQAEIDYLLYDDQGLLGTTADTSLTHYNSYGHIEGSLASDLLSAGTNPFNLAKIPENFHGVYFDAESDSLHMPLRNEDLTTMSFLSRDPVFDNFNAYKAWDDNPVGLRDPSGGKTSEANKMKWSVASVGTASLLVQLGVFYTLAHSNNLSSKQASEDAADMGQNEVESEIAEDGGFEAVETMGAISEEAAPVIAVLTSGDDPLASESEDASAAGSSMSSDRDSSSDSHDSESAKETANSGGEDDNVAGNHSENPNEAGTRTVSYKFKDEPLNNEVTFDQLKHDFWRDSINRSFLNQVVEDGQIKPFDQSGFDMEKDFDWPMAATAQEPVAAVFMNTFGREIGMPEDRSLLPMNMDTTYNMDTKVTTTKINFKLVNYLGEFYSGEGAVEATITPAASGKAYLFDMEFNLSMPNR